MGDKMTVGCQVVSKAFIKKNGQPADREELYLRCSVQDYFIKFCESEVSKEALTPFIDEGISVEMEVREGEWDICPDDPPQMQSRIGRYAVILKILE